MTLILTTKDLGRPLKHCKNIVIFHTFIFHNHDLSKALGWQHIFSCFGATLCPFCLLPCAYLSRVSEATYTQMERTEFE